MDYDAKRALELLKLGTNRHDATFRAGQEEAIRHVVEGRGRLLVVQKTGWGKSFVYFTAVKLLREAGAGPALLISPLLSLMRNQIDAAERMGVRAARITSDNQNDWKTVGDRLRRNEVDILLISPERLGNERFRAEVLTEITNHIALLIIDEAHCISDWGHDFRPDYRRIEQIVRTLPPNLRLLATTATANDRVTDDLGTVLGPHLEVLRGDLDRPSLSLQTIRLPRQSQRLAWLAEQLPSLPGHGIIYTLTIRDAHQVSEWLQSRGMAVEPYTGRTGERREELEQALLANRVKALVATTALGMGFDKPDLGFVIHYQTPSSVAAYYQQVGRAGRALDAAYGILLSGEEEADINDHFIASAFPTRDEVRTVLDTLEKAPEGLSTPSLLGEANLSQGRINMTLKLLSLESPPPIAKLGSRWRLTTAELSDELWKRAERLTRLRHEEWSRMQEYVNLESGHMAFLIQALNGDPDTARSQDLPPLPTEIDPALLQDAVAFLRRSNLPIEPRKKWPAGGLRRYNVKGNIPIAHRPEIGRALCIWGDDGWGELVRRGKDSDDRFADELVNASATLMTQWEPQPAPKWITCIPSRRHPTLVPDFAKRLATALNLPFHPVLEKTEERPEQKSMENSTQQARNVDGSLVISQRLPDGPVLLIDDMIDSRWTLTIASWLLRSKGCAKIWPLALASRIRGIPA